jgi:hypothetical protein
MGSTHLLPELEDVYHGPMVVIERTDSGDSDEPSYRARSWRSDYFWSSCGTPSDRVVAALRRSRDRGSHDVGAEGLSGLTEWPSSPQKSGNRFSCGQI